MKFTNRITAKIFFVILFSSFLEILGIVLVAYSVNRVYKNYNWIIDECLVNSDYMSEIDKLIMREHVAICNFVYATDDVYLNTYENEEKNIRSDLASYLEEFGHRMKGKAKEQVYHNVYSDCAANFHRIDIVIELRRNGNRQTAAQYISKNLVTFSDKFNRNLKILNSYISQELEDAQFKMKQYISFIWIAVITVTLVIVCMVAFTVIYCVRLSSNLENYKDSLEEDVTRKAKLLEERNEKLIWIQKNTIISMANLIENRDGDTGEHVKRTSMYVELIAKECLKQGYYTDILTNDYIELLIKAAPMHDVGKISVPDAILKKPGKLTPEEFDEMKKHTSEGYRIIHEVLGAIEEPDYVNIAADVAVAHHEKWNGTGYPKGLKEEEIPLCARIMAIADVFDALVSPRCYKEPFTPDKAFGIIEESSGSHFDPVLAKVFLSVKNSALKILGTCK